MEYESFLRRHQFALRVLGLWPMPGSRISVLGYFLYGSTFLSIFCFLFNATEFANLFLIYKELKPFAADLSWFLVHFVTCFKAFVFLSKIEHIQKICSRFTTNGTVFYMHFQNPGELEKKMLDSAVKKSCHYLILYYGLSVAVLFNGFVAPLYRDEGSNSNLDEFGSKFNSVFNKLEKDLNNSNSNFSDFKLNSNDLNHLNSISNDSSNLNSNSNDSMNLNSNLNDSTNFNSNSNDLNSNSTDSNNLNSNWNDLNSVFYDLGNLNSNSNDLDNLNSNWNDLNSVFYDLGNLNSNSNDLDHLNSNSRDFIHSNSDWNNLNSHDLNNLNLNSNDSKLNSRHLNDLNSNSNDLKLHSITLSHSDLNSNMNTSKLNSNHLNHLNSNSNTLKLDSNDLKLNSSSNALNSKSNDLNNLNPNSNDLKLNPIKLNNLNSNTSKLNSNDLKSNSNSATNSNSNSNASKLNSNDMNNFNPNDLELDSNDSNSNSNSWGLPYYTYGFCNAKYSPCYEISYTYQIFSTCSLSFLIIHCDNLYLFLVILCCSELKILGHSLETITHRAEKLVRTQQRKNTRFGNTNKKYSTRRNYAANLIRGGNGETKLQRQQQIDRQSLRLGTYCVKHHLAILEVFEELEEMYNLVILVQFLSHLVQLCFQMFLVSEISALSFDGLSMIAFVIAMVIQVYIFCQCGNEIETESMKVSQAAYNAQWTSSSESVKKTLLLMMLRAQHPVRFTVGKFAKLSLRTLVSVLKGSFSYFMVLRGI